MHVSLRDGRCRHRKGQLEIIDADDATMTAMCLDSGDSYLVETNTFGDGGIHYWPAFMAQEGEA